MNSLQYNIRPLGRQFYRSTVVEFVDTVSNNIRPQCRKISSIWLLSLLNDLQRST